MKRSLAAVLAVCALAAPALAQQSKLEQAIAKADEQLTKGKPDDAVKTLTKAAGEAGAAGQIALARMQERIGNLDAAAAAYDAAKASASGGDRADVLAAVANFTLRKGKATDALALAKQAVEAGQTPAALAVLARAQVRSGDGPGALASADKAVAAGATSALAHVARAEALVALGKNVEAEAAARKATELDPKSALAQSRLALALIRTNRAAEAVAAGKRATEVDDKFGEGFAMYGLALVAAEPQKNWSEAIAQAQQGAFLDLDNPHVQTAVGKIFETNGQLEQAANVYRKALASDPAYAAARLALIQAELNRGNRDAALEEAKKAEASAPSPELSLLIGENLARKGDYGQALGYLEKATKGLPGNPDAWALVGRAYHAARRYDNAADAYKKAVELAPQNANYRSTLGLILGQAGDLEGGLAELLKVTSTPGYKDAAGWTNLGWIYRNLNKPQESIAAYQKGLAFDPKQEQAALGLGWAYSYTKDYDKAIEAYNKAIQIDSKEAAADASLGIAWGYYFKSVKAGSAQDIPQAKSFADKAAAAGRNVTQLKDKIAELEKAIATGGMVSAEQMEQAQKAQQEYEEQNRKLQQLNAAARSKSAATRARAAGELARVAGGDSVDLLIYLMQADPDYDVRIAASNALGSLGSAARKAVPNMEGVLRQGQYEAPFDATPEQLNNQMKDGDYRKALRAALARIKG
jgi:superkiller protein 3